MSVYLCCGATFVPNGPPHECERSKAALAQPAADPVNHPKHYTSHPSGIECITITEHMGFNVGNAIKYLWRADEKGAPITDLEKARWYVDREIQRRLKQQASEVARGARKDIGP